MMQHWNGFACHGSGTAFAKTTGYLAFICQSGRERVAALEHDLICPSSQIFRESYQQTRLIAVEPPGNWQAALELGANFGSRPGAPNG